MRGKGGSFEEPSSKKVVRVGTPYGTMSHHVTAALWAVDRAWETTNLRPTRDHSWAPIAWPDGQEQALTQSTLDHLIEHATYIGVHD